MIDDDNDNDDDDVDRIFSYLDERKFSKVKLNLVNCSRRTLLLKLLLVHFPSSINLHLY